jgi:IclR family transcriptional regulator, mhp operon transcriptional activator
MRARVSLNEMMAASGPRRVKKIAALARGLEVLRLIRGAPGVRLAELHQGTGIPKATLLRVLETLEAADYIRRRLADGAYLPNVIANRPIPGDFSQLRLTELAAPSLEHLSKTLPWPADLGVRDGNTMLVLESNRSHSSLRVNRQVVGFRPHMLWSAMGRAYLAFCPEAEREEILAALRRSSAPQDRIARNEAWVAPLLADTRSRGYAVRDPRHESIDAGGTQRLTAIAVPIVASGCVLACLNCVWLESVMSEQEAVVRYLPRLKSVARAIARSTIAAPRED